LREHTHRSFVPNCRRVNTDAATVMDAWSTTERVFQDGNELLTAECADDLAESHASFQMPDGNGW